MNAGKIIPNSLILNINNVYSQQISILSLLMILQKQVHIFNWLWNPNNIHLQLNNWTLIFSGFVRTSLKAYNLFYFLLAKRFLSFLGEIVFFYFRGNLLRSTRCGRNGSWSRYSCRIFKEKNSHSWQLHSSKKHTKSRYKS